MLSKACEWLGAAAMVAAPFIIDTQGGKMLACFGLALLSFQAYKMRAFNLLLLNLAGIVGYIWSLSNG